jgi:autotransporter-associated beta strand protein
VFSATSTGGQARLVTNGGGLTEFLSAATGGSAQLITNPGGTVDISALISGMTAGSIEGAGTYDLGENTLTVGSNNLSTTVSGTINDGGIIGGTGGELIKVGTGTLTPTGTNTYTRGTTIGDGTLQIGNGGTTGSIVGNVTNNGTLVFSLATSGIKVLTRQSLSTARASSSASMKVTVALVPAFITVLAN